MKPATTANLYLILITALWGATFPIIRNAIGDINPYLFVALRFGIAALFILPLVARQLKNTNLYLLGSSLLFGTFNSVAYISQMIGLQTINSARSAFITGISVILVPFIAPFFKLGKPHVIDIISSGICLLGLYILTGASFTGITLGDKWTLLCALAFALQISYLQYISNKIKNYKLLTFYQLLFTTPLAIGFSIQAKMHTLLYPDVLIALVFCSIFATAIAYFLQIKYQKFTTAQKAAVIFALEPVFATLFAFLINDDKISFNTIIGGLFILFSLALPAALQLMRKTSAVETIPNH